MCTVRVGLSRQRPNKQASLHAHIRPKIQPINAVGEGRLASGEGASKRGATRLTWHRQDDGRSSASAREVPRAWHRGLAGPVPSRRPTGARARKPQNAHTTAAHFVESSRYSLHQGGGTGVCSGALGPLRASRAKCIHPRAHTYYVYIYI